MEKRIYGLKAHYIQNVYNVTFVEEENDIFASKQKDIDRAYDTFFEETWMGKKGLLQEISNIYEARTQFNEKKLFKEFVLRWGFISNSDKQSMKEFWENINFIALLLTRYSQIISKDLPTLKKWIKLKEPRKEIFLMENGVQYSIQNSETMSAKRGTRTMVSFNGDIRISPIETDTSLNDIQQNELASFQQFGFMFLTEVLYDLKIQSYIRPGRISLIQRNAYTPIQEIKVEPYLEIKDMKSALCVLLLMLLTKKQAVCQSPSCNAPFTPTRINNIYCSTTCSNYVKKKNYRDRIYAALNESRGTN